MTHVHDNPDGSAELHDTYLYDTFRVGLSGPVPELHGKPAMGLELTHTEGTSPPVRVVLTAKAAAQLAIRFIEELRRGGLVDARIEVTGKK